MRGLRVALLAWPRKGRAERGRELHGLLTEAADHGRTVGARDLLDVVAAGLAHRAARWASPRARARTGALAAGANAALALTLLLFIESPLRDGGSAHADPYGPYHQGVGPLLTIGGLLDLVLVAVPLALLAAGGAGARALSLVALVGVPAMLALDARPPLTLLAVQGCLALLVLLAPLHRRDAALVVAVSISGTAVFSALLLAAHPRTTALYRGDALGLLPQALPLAVGVMAAVALLAAFRFRGWWAPVAVVGAPLTLLRVLGPYESVRDQLPPAVVAPTLLLGAVVLAVVARRTGLRLLLVRDHSR